MLGLWNGLDELQADILPIIAQDHARWGLLIDEAKPDFVMSAENSKMLQVGQVAKQNASIDVKVDDITMKRSEVQNSLVLMEIPRIC